MTSENLPSTRRDALKYRTFRELGKLSAEETKAVADSIVSEKPAINKLTPGELFVVIKSLPLRKRGMEEEMGFGVDFLHMLLDREGVGHVVNFAREIQRISGEEEGVYEYDFDDLSARALSATRKRHFTREFGATMATGWFAAGVGTSVVAGAKTLTDSIDLYTNYKNGNAPASRHSEAMRDPNVLSDQPVPEVGLMRVRKKAKKLYDTVEKPLGGPVELAIGGLLTAEGVQKWKEKKDEQLDEIADAVSELAKRYPELKQPAPTEKGLARILRGR